MNYQIGGTKGQSGYDNSLYGNTGFRDTKEHNNILESSQVGDLLSCKLVKGGKEPILDINGIQMKTKATKELEGAQPGDTIYLKIQEANKNQISLKIVGVQSMMASNGLEAATGTQVMQNTEQMSQMVKDNLGGAQEEEAAKENQREILRNLSMEELEQLRSMQIDVTNATLQDLLGMVLTIRNSEHQDEVNEQIGDIVRETIGKLREQVLGGQEGKPVPLSQEETADALEETGEYTGRVRLNSEGYIVETPVSTGMEKSVLGGEAAYGTGGTNEAVIKGELPLITNEQMIYLIKNGKELTIANLELAKNSVNEESPSKEIPLNSKVWNDIHPQVTGIIEAAGMSVTEQSLGAAQFMLQHELPITVDSLRLYMAVNSVNQRGINVSQMEKNIEEIMVFGQEPEQARISGNSVHDKASQLVEKVRGINARAVDQAVLQGKPLSVSYLYNSSVRNVDMRRARGPVNTGVEGASLSLSGVGQDGSQPESSMPLSTNPGAVTARRQLEEIRLSMTTEAAIRLVRQDINIDAKPLSQIVEALREQENSYYDQMVSTQDLHDIPEDVDLFKETLKRTDGLKHMPAYTIGEMVKRPVITVSELYETGNQMKNILAGQAYETMMTRPRRDLGDSMQEAFQNVDVILEDLQLDRNGQNRRAIQILAYNEMELTKENILSVKVADAKVQQMFETLTPQIVLNLIREGKNPLHMSIDGLNEEIMQQREIRGITDEQRFSEFLYHMDRNDEITEAERKSFIGIYRLLDKIQKSHGKDIGAVVRNGQEVTLQNLFSADKSRKAQGINVAVDETFGQSAHSLEGGILDQVETAYQQTLAESMLRHIRPETLKNMENLDYRNMSFEELSSLWKEAASTQGDSELAQDIMSQLQEALSYEDEVATMLEANHMPETVTNMIAAHQVMYGEDGIYGMLHRLKNRLPKESREKITRQEARILDQMESREDVVYGLEGLRAAVSEEIHGGDEAGRITSMDIQALKYLNAGMPIAMRAVEEDVFQIPLVVGDRVSMMKVSILRDGSHAGEIHARMNTSQYGELHAFIHARENQIEGYIITEEEQGQRALEENELTLRSVFAKEGMEVKDLRLDGTKPMQYSLESSGEMTTGKLYRVAKQLVTAIKLTGILTDN